MTEEKLEKKPEMISFSKNKIINIGLIFTILNPIFIGLIYGLICYRHSSLKKEGKLIIFLSLIWGAILLAIVTRLTTNNL